MAPETDNMGQFLGPETDTFCQFLVQIVFFFFYWPEFWKKLLGPETDEMCQFLGPEADP